MRISPEKCKKRQVKWRAVSSIVLLALAYCGYSLCSSTSRKENSIEGAPDKPRTLPKSAYREPGRRKSGYIPGRNSPICRQVPECPSKAPKPAPRALQRVEKAQRPRRSANPSAASCSLANSRSKSASIHSGMLYSSIEFLKNSVKSCIAARSASKRPGVKYAVASMHSDLSKHEIPIGARISEAFASSEPGDFFSFLSNLGPGITKRKKALEEIARNPEKYEYLNKNGGDILGMTSQALQALQENMQLDRSELFAARFFPPSEKPLLSSASQKLEEKRVKGMEALKSLKLTQGAQDLCSVLLFFFSVPGVFSDLVKLKDAAFFKSVESECEKFENLERLSECVFLYRKKETGPCCLMAHLRHLADAAEAIVRLHRGRDEARLRREFRERLEPLIKCVEENVPTVEKAVAKNSSDPLCKVYMPMFQIFLAFYKICPSVVGSVQVEGKSVFLPDKVCTSRFKVNRGSNVMYCEDVVVEPSLEYRGFAGSSRKGQFSMQHVYYVDNGEYLRKPVIIPKGPAKIFCVEVIRYIAKMYSKPAAKIYAFSLNLSTHALTYKDPVFTLYEGPHKNSKEILVFYYIPEFFPKDMIKMTEFRPARETDSKGPKRVINPPLFLNNLTFKSLSKDCYTVCQKKASRRQPRVISSIHSMQREVPHVLVPKDPGMPVYHPQNVIDLDSHDLLGLDMSYALSSIKSSPKSSQSGFYFISYKTRKVECRKSSWNAVSTGKCMHKRPNPTAGKEASTHKAHPNNDPKGKKH
ncbi:uncharacterized protein NEMAJ01_1576 [Nematocida major]|uniref:uncharacterized protein n=1 Tax=Nematocida major TaxID=1912982 RepID=UPI0020084778|nr:uncharacterized protein NEMAJ01_1576 [Nematocida major]KAH9386680.1 hypothetical protein NEMAJ01_1576 [Nematocida major]